ncbi:MAG: hypothetical protein ACW964_00275 [Candidatus Hodarchaeales archaeon]
MIYVKSKLRYKSIVYATFIILILVLNVGSMAARRAESISKPTDIKNKEYPGWHFPRKVAFVYDSNNSLLTSTAFNAFTSAGTVYQNTHLVPVKNWIDLRSILVEDDEYWIKLYLLDGKIDGVHLGGKTIGWEEIAEAVSNPTTYHVFGSGSTDQLRPLIAVNQSKVRVEGSPVIGAEQSYFFYLWELGEILADDPGLGYQRAGEDFRILGAYYFADNINVILNGLIDKKHIKDPLGEEDVVAKKKAWDEKLEGMNDLYQVLPDNSIRRFENESAPIPETQLRIYNENETEEEKTFTISDIPLFSGLEGPVAGVVDAILSVLIKIGGGALGLDPNVAIDICTKVKEIALMFTNKDEGEGDVKDTIKSLISLVVDNAPISEKVKPFLPLVVDALYLIRAEPGDITDFAGSVIETIFTLGGELFKNTTLGNSTILTAIMKVLKASLLNGVDLADHLIEAKEKAEKENKTYNMMNEVVGFVIDKLLNASVYSWWSELFGGFNNSFMKDLSKLMGFLSPLIKAFATGDFDDLLGTIPEVVEYLFTKMSNETLTAREESACNTIGEFYRAAMTFFDTFTLGGGALDYWVKANAADSNQVNKKVLQDVINASIPMLNVTLIVNDSRPASFAGELVSIFINASIDQIASREQLKSLISSSMSKNSLPVDSSEAESLIDALAWLGAIWIPTIVNPVATDIEDLSKIFLDLTITENATISDMKEQALFVVIRAIFGIIALGKDNLAAQMLLLDDASEIADLKSSGGYDGIDKNDTIKLREWNLSIGLIAVAKDALVGLFNIWVLKITNSTAVVKAIEVLSDVIFTIAQVLISAKGNSIVSFLQSVAMQAGALFFDKVLGIDGTATMKIIQSLFTGLVGKNILGGEAFFNKTETMEDLQNLVRSSMEESGKWPEAVITLAEKGIYYLFMIKDLIAGGIGYIFKEFKTVLASFLADLISEFTGYIAKKISSKPLLQLAGNVPLPGGDAIGIKLGYNLSIGLNFEWDNEAFRGWIEEIIFTGINDFKLPTFKFFLKILTFLKFSPVFSAELTCETVDSDQGVFGAVLAPLGVNLEVWGSIGFSIQLFSFSSGGFSKEGFLKILEWHFSIGFKVLKEITLIDIILYCTGAGAAAASTVSKVTKFIGLDLLTLTIWLSAAFEIYQKAAHNGEPAQGSLTLTLGIGAFLSIGLNLRIVAIEFKIGLDIYLIFKQDLTPGNLGPFTITLDVIFWAQLTLTFLFWDWEKRFEVRPPGYDPFEKKWKRDFFPWKILPPPASPELKEEAIGYDSDNDGVSDDHENGSASLDMYNNDTDGDGLSDKKELKVSRTDPGKYDTDGDGLSDFMEWEGRNVIKSDPLVYDTDMDGLSDGEEVLLYGTDPVSRDTDQDGLTDFYEVTIAWDIPSHINKTDTSSNNTFTITPSVFSVQIGDTIYDNHTDPLNPDTDDDGLLDGQEGQFGAYYGNPANYPIGSDQPMIMFSEGYTHPLDNDTDDDSYMQYYDGSIAGASQSRVFLRDMRDGVEVKGIRATVIELDQDNFPELVSKIFQTNPCNPDSDGDTGVSSREVTVGYFLNSDGYELSLDPASDPLDGDVDDDGLIDGLEGTLLPERNVTTNLYNPDTDGDSLPDGIELALELDPTNPDTDNDLILDGDEYFIYNTNPHFPDTDFDGVLDYWELFFSHTNPHSADSDGDGIKDFKEIYVYGTDPMDDDSDNDDITDRDELFEFNTDPINPDSDNDGLRDGPEIFEYETDPNNIDSDFDSILSPNENGDPTFLWTDYDELKYGTDPKSIDTDGDGLLDTWELYLAEGDIPNFLNIPLDPLDNDTDDDGLTDGRELVVGEVDILVYPFIGYETIHPLITSPVDPDSDDDGLGDKYEVDNNLRPDLVDSDNDTLTDWDEIYEHNTDPRKNDTDGDGILDSDEITELSVGIGSYNPKYQTSALDPDSDSDGWPDGLELTATDGDSRYDPYESDTNNNGILDGYERDFDFDLISDGDEYYTYNSYGDDGGFLDYRNPDSDFDGLMDGDEILVYGTQPFNPDTDYDGYSDPLELWIGTDPLTFTSEEEFLAMVLRLTSPLQMKSPEHNETYAAGTISFEMLNLTTLSLNKDEVYFRFRKISSGEEINQTTNQSITHEWSDNYTLKYQGYSRWSHGGINFGTGEYELQVFGLATDYSYPTSPDRIIGSILLKNAIRFYVIKEEVDWGPIIILGFSSVIVLAGAAFITFWLRKRRRALI